MSILTLFTGPKPFSDPHIAMIQHNALRSWQALGGRVKVVITGDEEGIAEAAAEYGFIHRPNVARNVSGTPLLSSIFALAREATQSPLLAYVNADVLLFDDFLSVSQQMLARLDKFVLVGQRWDMDIRESIHFDHGALARLFDQAGARARLHPRGGSDYFIYPRACFETIPDFATGRAGWDNWMLYQARRQGWPLIDATQAITIIHQQHDYHHLPGGKTHHRLPESDENVRLAGGKRTIFKLDDASVRLTAAGELRPMPRGWKRFRREAQIWPLITLKSPWLAEAAFAALNPRQAYRAFRSALATRKQAA